VRPPSIPSRSLHCLQGPTETVDEAQAIVKDLMERPLPHPLLVDLTVDIKHADTWYEAK
jgi:DNA polymerase I-like protein with 3'-5' exonuclease and polymerase domains